MASRPCTYFHVLKSQLRRLRNSSIDSSEPSRARNHEPYGHTINPTTAKANLTTNTKKESAIKALEAATSEIAKKMKHLEQENLALQSDNKRLKTENTRYLAELASLFGTDQKLLKADDVRQLQHLNFDEVVKFAPAFAKLCKVMQNTAPNSGSYCSAFEKLRLWSKNLMKAENQYTRTGARPGIPHQQEAN